MRLTRGQVRECHARELTGLTGLQFYDQIRTREKTFFVFLEKTSCFHHQLLQVELGSFLVLP